MSRHFGRGAALPTGWTRHIRSSLVQAISLAATAWTIARSQAVGSRSQRQRLQAELDRANIEIAVLKEELGIKDGRWSHLCSRRRRLVGS